MKLRSVFLGGAMAALALACTSAPQTDSAAGAGASSAARGAVPLQSGQTRQQLFDRLDADGSGSVSRAEAQASPALMLIFVDMDANADGELSADEWRVVPLVNPDGTRVP